MNKPITDIREKQWWTYFFLPIHGGDEAMTIGEVANSTSSSVTFYTLDGVQIEQPTQPGIYIEKKDGTTKKIWLTP